MPQTPHAGHQTRHQCLIYSGSPSAHLGALAATIREKLRNNFRCLYLNSPPMVAGMRSYLAAAGVDVVHATAKASLVLSSEMQQLANGTFDIDRMMALLEDALAQALDDNYQGLWASGDMTWEFGPEKDTAKLLEYEWRLEEFFQGHPELQGVCQYHAEMFSPEELRQAAVAHPGVYINETLARHNPHFRQPRAYGSEVAADSALDAAVRSLDAALG